MEDLKPAEHQRLKKPDRDDPGPSARLAAHAGLVLALSVLLASFSPAAVFPAVLASLVHLAAWMSAIVAAVRRDPLFPGRLTNWDVAAGFWMISMIVAAFVDPEALRAFAEANLPAEMTTVAPGR